MKQWLSLSISWLLTAALFALAVNKISSQKPASIAGNCSPIEAIRYTAVSGMSKTKHLKSKKRDGGSIFAMAMQNIFRDKNRQLLSLPPLL